MRDLHCLLGLVFFCDSKATTSLGKTLKSCEMNDPDNMCCISIVAMKGEAKPAIDKTNELWLRYIAASAQKY